jgi:hypothetical protein
MFIWITLDMMVVLMIMVAMVGLLMVVVDGGIIDGCGATLQGQIS